MNEYSLTDIEVIDGLEAVRIRPKLWIGSTDASGLHQLVWELVYNCLDEYNVGYCHHIVVTLNSNGSISVDDDGRGIPTSVSEKTGKTGVEILFSTLGCPTGFALAVVNALSERLEVEVYRDGKQYKKTYQRGKDLTPLEFIGNTNRHGTQVTILPDKDIFAEAYHNTGNQAFDFDELATRLRELAFLNSTLSIELADPQNSKRETFIFNSGISDYLSWLNDKQVKVNDVPVYLSGQRELPADNDCLNFECVLQWTYRKDSLSLVFFNSDPVDEKIQLADISTDLARPLNEFARANHLLNEHECDISDTEISKGISTILSIKAATTLRWLDKQYLRNLIKDAIQDCFRQYLQTNKDDATCLIKALKNSRINFSEE